MTIQLNNSTQEPFIDFIKGVAIIFVILNHSIQDLNLVGFPFWGALAIPLFLIIQSWHVFKKDKQKTWREMVVQSLKRVFLPFYVLQIFFLTFLILFRNNSEEIWTILKPFLRSGGDGMGSYYVWIFLQMAILIPIVKKISERVSRKKLIIILLAISIFSEIICCVLSIPEFLYRLLAVRYVFLIYFGYDWAINGIRLRWQEILLSIASLILIWMFSYNGFGIKNLFYPTWNQFHWCCYFYPAYLFIFFLHILFKCFGEWISWIIQKIGQSTYSIYLFQMAYFFIILHCARPYVLYMQMTPVMKAIVSVVCCVLMVSVFKAIKYNCRQLCNKR